MALIAAFLMALFPTDVIFATINFVDSSNVFFINLGTYFLLKSYFQNKISLAYPGGFFFFISMQFKENIYYTSILLFILLIYLLVKYKIINIQIAIGLAFIAVNFLLEGFVYLLLHNDFLYRLTITKVNYTYSFYDFFPYTAQKFSGAKDYWRNLFDQIFLINGRSIFPRRFYLFLPIIASIQSLILFKKKNHLLLIYWFVGTAILLIAFTTSFNEYKPLDLQRSWYIYPLLMPTVILAALFVNNVKRNIKYALLIIYAAGSFIMCHHYEGFFDKENLKSMNSFLRKNKDTMIYTDHFTKYSVDLIRNYEQPINSKRILGENFDLYQIKKGDWVLYNEKHIDELKLQKYQFPDFRILESDDFKNVAVFNDFIFYEKVSQ